MLTADRSALMSFYTVTLAAGGALGSVIGGVATGIAHANGLIALGFVLSAITFLSLGPVMRYARDARRRSPAITSRPTPAKTSSHSDAATT